MIHESFVIIDSLGMSKDWIINEAQRCVQRRAEFLGCIPLTYWEYKKSVECPPGTRKYFIKFVGEFL